MNRPDTEARALTLRHVGSKVSINVNRPDTEARTPTLRQIGLHLEQNAAGGGPPSELGTPSPEPADDGLQALLGKLLVLRDD